MPALAFPFSRQTGLAAAQAIVALAALISLTLLALDTLSLYSLRVRLHHALLQTARQASTHHANPEQIAATFTQGLHRARASRRNSWQIRILSPSASAFAQHGRPSNRHALRPTIRQAWQAQQHALRPDAQPSIFQANTLHLQLHYHYQPAPWSALRALSALTAWLGYANRSLLIRVDIQHPMQSDPVRWADLPNGRVVYGPA
ncbi:hypothetical protein [Alcaligenes sp. SDU_A2]|uniref:hypothetical protein n=1 Tax=Alcaligenes sp. SDU_A2 TaxID=3136634 RepID=UPI00311D75F8